ncbi:MAG TPA: prephenate dehydratase domain-containing protein, partial [Clostridia bacterium]|nr:prephenate dehydratase domain-containing protein [Clostridia bacterium]
MNIEDLRKEINKTDNQIVKSFEKRMSIAKDIAEWKLKNNKPVYDKSRENDVLERVAGMVDNELSPYVKSLYSTIFSLSRSYQLMNSNEESELTRIIGQSIKPLDSEICGNSVVACQGIDGAYSQIACKKIFENPEITYFRNFQGVFKAVESGLCKYGILPIENSSYGSVTQVYDLMKKHNFYIVKSVKLRINHELLAREKTKMSDIKEIYSHEQAIGQCNEFLNSLEGAKVYQCENTAVAARMASESGRDDVAAISSENCAKLYGLKIVKKKIQNNENNYTRFI